MRHLREGRKLKRTSSHRKALLSNLATALFEHKRIRTTEAKAKELRPFAERLITKAKNALAREQQGLLPEGQKIDIHNRRIVARYLKRKAVLQELFETIAPTVSERPGGYTRIVKLGARRGDASKLAIIELVDWSQPQDGAVSLRRKKKTTKAKKSAKPKEETKETKAVTAVSQPVDSVPEETQTKLVEDEVVEQTQENIQEIESTQETDETKEPTTKSEQAQDEVNPQNEKAVSEDIPADETAKKEQSDDEAEKSKE